LHRKSSGEDVAVTQSYKWAHIRASDLHGNERIRRSDDERVKGYDRGVGIILERSDYLHFIPPE
jgi:hypothetical protein